MEKRASGDGTVAGVNGDLFSLSDGHPTGGLIRGGVLDTAPADARSTIGVDTDGTLHVDRVSLAGTWQGSGQRRILGINEPPRAGRTTLYTRAWGARTPAESGGAYATLQPFPATRPNTPLTATVTGYATGGSQPIPADGAVLVARGPQAGFLSAVDERARGRRRGAGNRARRQAGLSLLRELHTRAARLPQLAQRSRANR